MTNTNNKLPKRSGVAVAARQRSSAGPMKDKRERRSKENQISFDYESDDYSPEESEAMYRLAKHEQETAVQESNCWCYHCFGEKGPRGQDSKCEYFDHHCDMCHAGQPRLCTKESCNK